MATYRTYLLLLSLLFLKVANGQVTFIRSGAIDFERVANIHAIFDWGNTWTEEYKRTVPPFKTTSFTLVFNKDSLLFRPGAAKAESNDIWDLPNEDNIVFTDLEHQLSVSCKKILEKTYLVADSIKKIKWRITGERRTIAGFECKRANGIILDSVYVVAFYTDDIVPPGGPESFTGLPGMILGIALPHEHITWFATKVRLGDPGIAIKAPLDGERINSSTLDHTIKTALQLWDRRAAWRVLLGARL